MGGSAGGSDRGDRTTGCARGYFQGRGRTGEYRERHGIRGGNGVGDSARETTDGREDCIIRSDARGRRFYHGPGRSCTANRGYCRSVVAFLGVHVLERCGEQRGPGGLRKL